MELQTSLTYRQRTLSHPAAEFVEGRGRATLGISWDAPSPVYDPGIDSFVPPSRAIESHDFENSRKRLPQIEHNLTRLHNYLKKNKLDGEVQLKNPSNYTSDDVLEVLKLAEKVQKIHENAIKVPGWIPKLRGFARSFGRNASGMKSLIDFIPDTTYTSIICACLAGILTTATRIDTVREDLYTALAEIPDRMEKLCGYTNDIHRKSNRLCKSADLVYVEILEILECLIRELTANPLKKTWRATVRGAGYSTSIKKAVEKMEKRMESFKDHVNYLNSRRLGECSSRLEEMEKNHTSAKKVAELYTIRDNVQKPDGNMKALPEESEGLLVLPLEPDKEVPVATLEAGIETIQKYIELQNRKFENSVNSSQTTNASRTPALRELEARLKKIREDVSEISRTETAVNLYNAFYTTAASSPLFNARQGTINEFEFWKRKQSQIEAIPDTQVPSRLPAQKLKLERRPTQLGSGDASSMRNWIEMLKKPRETALQDIQENLNWIADAKNAEQDQIEYLLTSDSIRQWLNAKNFYILSMSADTSPEGTFSPISYTTAMLAQTLLESKTCLVLSYFCGIRCWQPDTKQKKVAVSFLSSLIGQLLEEASEKVPGFDPSCLRDRTRKDTLVSIDAVLLLLEDLFRALPPKSSVFVLVDSVSRLEMKVKDKARGKKAIEGLLAAASRAAIPVKLVFTDLLHAKIPASFKSAVEQLDLPDQVDDGNYSFHPEMAQEETRLAIDQSFQGSDGEDA